MNCIGNFDSQSVLTSSYLRWIFRVKPCV